MPAGAHRFQVGNLRCTVLSDGYVANPASWLFPNADEPALTAALERRGSDCASVVSPYTCLLIETGQEIVLADAGLGNGSNTSGAILARLEMAGVRPPDVTTVIFTHAHPDHIAGAVDGRDPRALRPMFPNARCVMSEAEWDFWSSAHVDMRGMRVGAEAKAAMHLTARRCLDALRHQVELICRETEIAPGIHAIPAPGHTPGHLALLMSSEGKELLNLGDAATDPLHLKYPQWENGFDLDSSRALATRRTLAEWAAVDRIPVMAFHFPFPGVGLLTARADAGWDWTAGG